MGTPDFAVSALEAIINAGHEVAAVVTQPDRAKGRSGKLMPSPVKEVALKYNIPVLQPQKIRAMEAIEQLRKFPADVFVVAAFGQILPAEVLNMPKYGCVNIHASLLPHLRGAAPIQQSILLGDKESGITIMQMDEGLDTGDILLQEAVAIEPHDTGGTLFDKLALLGAKLIVKALPMLEAGELKPVPQKEELADYAGMLKKSMGKIDFSLEAEQIERRVRGFNPWPAAYTCHNGRQLKLWKAYVADLDNGEECPSAGDMSQNRQEEPNNKEEALPGTITAVSSDAIYVQTGKGLLRIDELQPEGKRRMSTKDFLLGYRLKTGDRLE